MHKLKSQNETLPLDKKEAKAFTFNTVGNVLTNLFNEIQSDYSTIENENSQTMRHKLACAIEIINRHPEFH